MKVAFAFSVLSVGALLSAPLSAQRHPDVLRAQRAYDAFDLRQVIPAARSALIDPSLTMEDRRIALELLGFTYGALDSANLAQDSFRRLLIINPDFEPDAVRVSPRIYSLYSAALGQVLVVRNIQLDTTSFVGGEGAWNVGFEVTRPARVVLRAVGGGIDLIVDSLQTGTGAAVFTWDLSGGGDSLLPPNRYQIILQASEGNDQFSVSRVVEVSHSIVDTLLQYTEHPARDTLPSTDQPGRSWKPLGLATLYTALASGATLALENSALGSPARREIGGVALVAIVTGFVLSLRQPDPVLNPGNIAFNQMLREDLARLNADITVRNIQIRNQVRVTVTPLRPGQE